MCSAMDDLIAEGRLSAAAAAAAALPLYCRDAREVEALVAGADAEWELLEKQVGGTGRAGTIVRRRVAGAPH
jgi:hypothetical protein